MTDHLDPSIAAAFLRWRYGAEPAQVVYGDNWLGAQVEPSKFDALLDRVGDQKFYFHACDLRSAWSGTTAKPADVTGAQFIWFDFDAEKFGKKNDKPSDASRAHYQRETARITNALETAFTRLGIKPSAMWLSGPAGRQGLIRLDRTIPADQACDLGRKLAAALGSDASVYNGNRLLRVPGSINTKTEHGREPALARMFGTLTDIVTTVEELEAALAGISVPAKPDSAPGGLKKGGAAFAAKDTYDRIAPDDQRLAKLEPKWLALGRDGDATGEYSVPGKHRRSGALFAFCIACVRAEVSDDVIAAVITDPSWKISAPILEKHGLARRREVTRTILRAHEAAIDPKLAEMNEIYHVILLGGKCKVLFLDDDEVHPGRKTPVYMAPQEFINFHANEHHLVGTDKKGNPIYMPLGEWWWKNRHRRQYSGITYEPGRDEEVVAGKKNLWQGFRVAPAGGNCHLFLRHLLHNVCDGDQTNFKYLLRWMAYLIQFPDRQGEVALVLRGLKGVGKTIVADILGFLFGRHYIAVTNPEHLTGKFNPHLQECSLVLADECFNAAILRNENILKTLITGSTIIIEPKGTNPFKVRNRLHLILCSNSKWAVPATHDERRYFVLTVAPHKIQDRAYFGAIIDQMRGGGYAALLRLLQGIDLSDFDITDVPRTVALRDQQARSRKGIDLLVEEMLHEGRVPFSHQDKPHIGITSGEEHAKGFDNFIRSKAPIDLRALGPGRVKNELKSEWGATHFRGRIAGRIVAGIEFPALSEMRAKFEAKHGAVVWRAADAKVWEASDDGYPF